MAKQESHWEVVNRKNGEQTDRLAVPGGWLYRTHLIPWTETTSSAVAMVFVPDPKASTNKA